MLIQKIVVYGKTRFCYPGVFAPGLLKPVYLLYLSSKSPVMAETNATILIPDISGFTEFMTTTELTHSTKAINILIDAMIKAVEDVYEVSEIEGDAVLLIKKGEAPSAKEILDTCLKIFTSFHTQRIWLQQHAICPCGACQAISNLTLKFVVHHGVLAEIKVGRFVKQSGTEMIVAHRLLKNSIASNEYLLVTEKLLQQSADFSSLTEIEWTNSSEEYASIGKVDYRYALLNEARKKIPEPLKEDSYEAGGDPVVEISIAANYKDVYMVLMNIPGRPEWLKGLQKVEQEIDGVFIGSTHYCDFENYKAVVSPLRMILSEEAIIYAEQCTVDEINVSLVHEFVCKKESETSSVFSSRLINNNTSPIPEDVYASLVANEREMAERLKEYCEKMEVSMFEPMVRHTH